MFLKELLPKQTIANTSKTNWQDTLPPVKIRFAYDVRHGRMYDSCELGNKE